MARLTGIEMHLDLQLYSAQSAIPGAFTKLENDVLRIWRARPFEEHQPIVATHALGEIIKIFENGDLFDCNSKVQAFDRRI